MEIFKNGECLNTFFNKNINVCVLAHILNKVLFFLLFFVIIINVLERRIVDGKGRKKDTKDKCEKRSK